MTDMTETFTIEIGGLVPKMEEQLAEFSFSNKDIKHFQKMHDAIVLLSAWGLITSKEGENVRRKFVKFLAKRILQKRKEEEGEK
jgi:hypothetical protein